MQSACFSLVVAVVVSLSTNLSARAEQITVPTGFENQAGGFSGVTPFRRSGTTGSRGQILYDGSLLGGPALINSIAFRPVNFAFPADPIPTLVIDDITLSLSTSQRAEGTNPLSPTFADNVGADSQVVYSGSLTLTPQPITGNGLRGFDYLIQFQTPFLFDPALGNLLLDSVIPAGTSVQGTGAFGSFVELDYVNPAGVDGISTVSNINAETAVGTLSSAGPITQFQATIVPEPAGGLLLMIGVGVLTISRRQRRRRRSAA